MMVKFCVKESSMALKILRPQGFPLQPGWGGISPISQKVTKCPPIKVSPTQFSAFSPWKPYSAYYYLKWEIKV